MTPHRGTGPERGEVPATLVWVDREEALIVRWEGSARIERLASDVADGVPEDRIERERLGRLRAFVRDVAARVPTGDDVRIVGPGDVRLRLGRILRDEDRRLGRRRVVDTRAAGPLTEGQLVAHVREIAGDPPPRLVRAR